MNGPNGYSPNYGAPPQQPPGGYGPPQSQAPGYGPPPQQGYAAPSPYGAAPSPYGAAPAPYGQVQYPQAQPGMGNPLATPKNPGLAVALELLGGFFFQTFGIGHLYAGNVGVGLGLMFGYWVLTAINFALCFVVVGFVTWPLTWLAFMILASITANNAAKKTNAKNMGLAV